MKIVGKLSFLLSISILSGCSIIPAPDLGFQYRLKRISHDQGYTNGVFSLRPSENEKKLGIKNEKVKIEKEEALSRLKEHINNVGGNIESIEKKVRRKKKSEFRKKPIKMEYIYVYSNFPERKEKFDLVKNYGRISNKDPKIIDCENKLKCLGEEIVFTDVHGVEWVAPIGTKTDGASIPKFFQGAYGDPYEKTHLVPAILHDYWIDERNLFHNQKRILYTPRDVNLMFYQALIHFGTDLQKANEMYLAVQIGGPKWEWKDEETFVRLKNDMDYQDQVLSEIKNLIKENPELLLDEIINIYEKNNSNPSGEKTPLANTQLNNQ